MGSSKNLPFAGNIVAGGLSFVLVGIVAIGGLVLNEGVL